MNMAVVLVLVGLAVVLAVAAWWLHARAQGLQVVAEAEAIIGL